MKWMNLAAEIAASMKCPDTPFTHATKTTKSPESRLRSSCRGFGALPQARAGIDGRTPENDATKTTKTPKQGEAGSFCSFCSPFLRGEQKNLPAPAQAKQAPTEAPASGGMQDWQTLDKAYQAHHFACRKCSAAGQGRGKRCDIGLALWRIYSDAPIPARQGGAGQNGQHETPRYPPHPRYKTYTPP